MNYNQVAFSRILSEDANQRRDKRQSGRPPETERYRFLTKLEKTIFHRDEKCPASPSFLFPTILKLLRNQEITDDPPQTHTHTHLHTYRAKHLLQEARITLLLSAYCVWEHNDLPPSCRNPPDRLKRTAFEKTFLHTKIISHF